MRRRALLLSPLALYARPLSKPHPRLYLDAQGFERLKQSIGGTHAALWARVKAPAYPAALGLKSFVRRLYFLKPDVLIVADEIEVDRPKPLELLYHLEDPVEKTADNTFVARGRTSILRVEPLTPEGLEIHAGESSVQLMNNAHAPRVYEVRLMCGAARWRNAVAFSWAPAGQEPRRVTLDRSAKEVWTFVSGARKTVLNWKTV